MEDILAEIEVTLSEREIDQMILSMKPKIEQSVSSRIDQLTNTIIKYKGRVYDLDDVGISYAEFVETHIEHRITSYRSTLLSLKRKDNIYAKRNKTNTRLDSNITNLHNDFIPHLRYRGQRLVSVDLRNSQFTLLSLYLRGQVQEPDAALDTFIKGCKLSYVKKQDVERFIEVSAKGILYEEVAKVVWGYVSPDSRSKSKNLMYKIFFGRYTQKIDGKEQLRAVFPNVIKFIDEFKEYMCTSYRKEYYANKKQFAKKYGTRKKPFKSSFDVGNDYLSIQLQRLEADIFVDVILARLFYEQYIVLSKHDSILCLESDLEEVKAIMEEELNKIMGQGYYTLKVFSSTSFGPHRGPYYKPRYSHS